jgi:serine phosphatase RsbU (regulator of sigma subunit)
LRRHFTDLFVLFRPRNIVSGDFYWFGESNENKVIALADCTGHGVPGGFMSMLGFEILQDMILREEIRPTSDALSRLDEKLTATLNKNSRSYRDGMDMALCAFRQRTNLLQYSGANRPLVHIAAGGILTIYKPDKHPIGGGIDETEKVFTHTEIRVSPGDMIYLFSDGYPDQFGGSKGKKFMLRKFEDLLVSIHSLPLQEQKQVLLDTFEEWRCNLEQVDDVCMIGLRI